MLTANDIQNVSFSKSVGGYKAAEVDEFIDRCAQTVSALTIAKNELEKKLEVLADKLVEYRNDEDNIRTALMSAQKLGDTVIREAKHKAGLILDDARIKAEKISETAEQNIKNELAELERIKLEVTNFKARLLSIYREHLSLIDVLPEVEDKKEKEQEQEQEPENGTDEQSAWPDGEQSVETAGDSAAKSDPDEDTGEKQGIIFEEKPEDMSSDTDQTVETNPRSRFGDLKFGDGYDISKDDDEDDAPIFKRRK